MNIDNVELSQFPADLRYGSNADERADHKKAQNLLPGLHERDKDKIQIPHPRLPNTWLLVSREKAKKLGYDVK